VAPISSISNSEQRLEPTVQIVLPLPRRTWLAHPFLFTAIRYGRRFPTGALLACLIVAMIHWAAVRVSPHPIAAQGLREKVMALTTSAQPKVIIAGDSRAKCGIEPWTLASQLQLPENEVVNIGRAATGSAAMLNTYREFADRFIDKPIMLINTSVFAVNDATPRVMIDEEWLSSLTWNERRQLVGTARATAAEFFAEKALWFQLLDTISPGVPPVHEQGFSCSPASESTFGWSQQKTQERSHALIDSWYGNAKIDGIRWKKFETSLQAFLDAGVQIVLVEMPFNPRFVSVRAETPAGRTAERLHRKHVQLCERLNIPLLSFDETCIADEPIEKSFSDCVHLNRQGAALFSQVLAKKVENLIRSGRLQLPGQ